MVLLRKRAVRVRTDLSSETDSEPLMDHDWHQSIGI